MSELEEGKCFLCKKTTEDSEAYIHLECAIAYSEQIQNKRKIKQKEKDGN